MADDQKILDYLKRVTVDLHDTRLRLQEMEEQRHESIAIVGMSCRYPGGINSPNDLWGLVAAGRDAVSAFPTDRGWDLEGLYDSDPDRPGKCYAREGGFLYDAGSFDAGFFGISPREALAMDPQQRLLLEVSWEALEDGDIDPASLRGGQVGVFVGISSTDYVGSEGHQHGNLASVATGRIAYTLGLEGPAVTVDTACSSSLVALHHACQSLRAEECSLALAGGVTLMTTPGGLIEFSRQRGLAPDGRCKAFSERADGTGIAEGVGMLLVERLSHARRLGHPVLAVVRGSAINQDGASNGLTAPNGLAQQRVIAQALANARLSAGQVDAVEAHGTGTTLGDPIEAQALLATYGQGRQEGAPLWLGSIKSNIGHTQGAAGVAGVIKMVMAMRNRVLPPTLHIEEPSRQVDWSAGAVSLLSEATPWPQREEPRRAGVSSFGISGTNAHAILEEAPPEPVALTVVEDAAIGVGGVDAAVPWIVSAKSATALRDQARRLLEGLEGERELGTIDVGCALAQGRSEFEHRAAVIGSEERALRDGLGALADGRSSANVVEGVAGAGARGAVFTFPGQGSQWVGMALELLEGSPVFAEQMRACEDALAPHVDWSLMDVLGGSEEAPGLDRVDVVQPASFAVMVSLAKLWRACGVEPSVVVGHSQGEIAAAYVAGGLSLDDAARVVALRSQALSALAGEGGMVSVSLGAQELAPHIERWGEQVALAAVNGPSSVVVSGERKALEEVLGELAGKGIRAREIPVDYASHSAQVERIHEQLLDVLSPISPRSGDVPFYSTAIGELLDTAALDAEYWYRSLRETVRFEQVTRELVRQGYRAFVEISSHPVLTMGVQETVEDMLGDSGDAAIVGSLRRGEGGLERFLSSLGEAWTRGVDVNWGAVFAGSGAGRVALPTYAFQRERYWLSTPAAGAGDVASIGQAPADHPLLGAVLALADGEGWLFTGRLSLQTHPWLADHAALGTVLLPGTAFVELALRAGSELGCEVVRELTLQTPLVLPEQGGVQLQVSVGESEETGFRSVDVYSRAENAAADQTPHEEPQWTCHASGILAPGATILEEHVAVTEEAASFAGGAWPPAGVDRVQVDDLYDRLAEAGYEYGPAFQGLRAVWRRGQEVFAEVSLPEDRQGALFAMHPALLDCALHAIGTGLRDDAGEGGPTRLPFSWGGVGLYARGASRLRVRLSLSEADVVSLVAADEDGAPVVTVSSLVLREVSPEQLERARAGSRESLFCLDWIAVQPARAISSERWAVLGARGMGLAGGLEEAGIEAAVFEDLQALVEAADRGGAMPEVVLLDGGCGGMRAPGDGMVRAAHVAAHGALGLVQAWLADERFSPARLVLVTEGAVATRLGEDVPGLASAPVWGLVRSAQSENPQRLVLLDLDGEQASLRVLAEALACDEPQLAVRQGELLAPRLVRGGSGGGALIAPAGSSAWRLDIADQGTLENLALLPCPDVEGPLEPGQIRVAMRAAGLNFRDVMVSLGLVSLSDPSETLLGSEGAGVVMELGPGVSGFAVGDRVLGLFPGAFGPVAVTDHHVVAHIPAGWSFTKAASVPVVFLTAYYGLVDVADLQPGESVVIHAAAGGVGMAAVQLARHLGAEVFGTANPQKWDALESIGLDAGHLASSRTLEFRESFLERTEARGVDVVLDCLAGEFVDASLELLPRGGRFVEIGKTDIRDPSEVETSHPGVAYRAFDLMEAGPERLREILTEVLELCERGVLDPLPVATWDVRRAREAFRFLSQARHVGKIVLRLPSGIDSRGSVLITGGTGRLGSLVARHLVAEHGVRSVVLASRQGSEAEGASQLCAELESLGAEIRTLTCDVADREQVAQLLQQVPEEYPLTAVVHAAGALDDGVIESLTDERLDRVLVPKVDAAWHLHELTAHLDLSAFILFSSVAGTFGGAGQGNYAAANVFLDGLAAHRRARGLAGISMAWGWWAADSGMTGHLADVDRARLKRLGVAALPSDAGLALFDAACETDEALVAPVRLDHAALNARARSEAVPALLRAVLRTSVPRAVEGIGGSLARRLAGVPERERRQVAMEMVRSEAAIVLGHVSGEAIDSRLTFKELGFDSLTAVELRNRLSSLTGLRLPVSLVFDHPTPAAVVERLLGEIEGSPGEAVASMSVVGSDDPIAIVGMSCRYPGGVHSAEGLWDLISSGGDAISEFPTDRGWDLDALYDPDPAHAGTSYVRAGGFLDDAAEFDAGFFGISPREALAMDPQQRLLLEAAWEAFEDAGIDPTSLRGSQTGVFAGAISPGFDPDPRSVPESLEGFLSTGSASSVVSGRVAYVFGLEGPAVTVDTACSSSLVALHLACQALRGGECSLALAGGVTVLTKTSLFTEFSRQRGLARDGRCRSFADAADGTSFSEGVGVVLLEPLSAARRAGHEVLAVVRGSALNQDGASNGLAAPNGPSQQRVIRQALANAGLSTVDVDVVEAHGTGTTLGDPIEAQALLATYGRDRHEGHPLWLGSVKSNIGHTQGAAGVAGVIKMVMAMRRGVLPKTLHVEAPSRKVDWSAGAVSLLSEAVPWEVDGRPRRAGVSSFGISGTNAHVILEEAAREPDPLVGDAAGVGCRGGAMPWVLSGRGVDGLRGQAERLSAFVDTRPGLDVGDVGFSLAARAELEYRGVVVGDGREGLLEGLGALARGESGESVVEGAVAAGSSAAAEEVVFLFPGQGSQWVGMAVELLGSSPVFAERMGLCEEALAPHVDWSLGDVLRGGVGVPGLDRVDVVQPVLWAVMVSLAGLWEACGVRPGLVVGHSQGEIAAAFVAGGLSLEDAARLVVLRSRALVGLVGRGGMVSVAAGVGEVEGWLERWGGVSVAAVNGPSSVVVSGEREALDGLLSELVAAGVRAREIPVGYASHSVQIEEIREELLDACAGIVPVSGGVPFFSTVTGGLVDTRELDGEYWYRNLRGTVRFEGVVRLLLEEGYRAFVEVSPHPVLGVGVYETADEALDDPGEVVVVGSLRREQGGLERFLTSVGEAWVRGVDVDWGRVFAGSGARRVGLPSYAFQRERYWLASRAGGVGDMASAGLGGGGHPLLGAACELADGGGWLFTGRLSLDTHPWLADHRAMGIVLLPGTAFVELALHAGMEVGCDLLEELTLQAPLTLPEGGAAQLQLSVGAPGESGRRPVSIYSRSADSSADGLWEQEQTWTCHAEGTLTSSEAVPDEHVPNGQVPNERTPNEHVASEREVASLFAEVWPPAGAEPLPVDDVYDRLAEQGYDYGPAFQGLTAAWRREEEVFAEVALPEEQQVYAGEFGIHPALFDAALHAAGMGLFDTQGPQVDAADGRTRLPFSWRAVALYGSGASRLRVRLSRVEADAMSLWMADENGAPVAAVKSLVLRPVSVEQLGGAHGGYRKSLFCLGWPSIPGPPSAPGVSAGEWALLGADGEVLAETLGEAGIDAHVHADLRALGEAVDGGARAPAAVLVDCAFGEVGAPEDGLPGLGSGGGVLEAARATTHRALGLVQSWLGDERFSSSRLVLLTRNAVAVGPDEGAPGLVQAPVWGLVRSAQSENPGRFVLVDLDDQASSVQALGVALATGEPQLAIRDGNVHAPRLARSRRVQSRAHDDAAVDGGIPVHGGVLVDGGHPVGDGVSVASGTTVDDGVLQHVGAADARGTVLVTGGLGGLGALLARHLVAEHGVPSVVLAGRRGLETEGAPELRAELESLGARVTVAACDVANRGELESLLGLVPAEHPLSAVVHAAGVLDDGLVEALTTERVDRVLAPKLAAWHLHELTEHLDLSAFVLFSSAAGTFGTPGQGNYAAANTFLDALAAYRRARGLVGTSMAWGLWAKPSGMTGHLNDGDLTRLARSGVTALSRDEGLELFDTARATEDALVVPVRLDGAALRVQAQAGMVPAVLRDLVSLPSRRRPDGAGDSLARRLASASGQERERVLLEMVRAEIAGVLNHASPGAVEVGRTFKELGFDSLTAVELRNRLCAATGLRLPATLVFDYPTAAAVADHLLTELLPNAGQEVDLDSGEAELREALASIPLSRLREAGLMDALMALANSEDGSLPPAETDDTDLIDAMDVEGLVRMTFERAES